MKGNNKFILNEATMIAALQYYFEEVIFQRQEAPTIASVGYNIPNNVFEIKVEGAK